MLVFNVAICMYMLWLRACICCGLAPVYGMSFCVNFSYSVIFKYGFRFNYRIDFIFSFGKHDF